MMLNSSGVNSVPEARVTDLSRALPEAVASRLRAGDPVGDGAHLPLLYSRR